jgi:hypothetical protein
VSYTNALDAVSISLAGWAASPKKWWSSEAFPQKSCCQVAYCPFDTRPWTIALWNLRRASLANHRTGEAKQGDSDIGARKADRGAGRHNCSRRLHTIGGHDAYFQPLQDASHRRLRLLKKLAFFSMKR